MTHVRTECIRPGTPLLLEDARRLVEGYVEHYNDVRLNSAIGYIRPKDSSPAVSTRSMLSATGSWRRRGSNGRFAASKPLDVQLTSVGRGSA